MSFFNSINNLEKKILQKSIISITGNIDDLIPPSLLKTEVVSNVSSNKLLSISEYLFLLLKKMNYSQINYFNPSTGQLICDEQGNIEINKISPNQPFADFVTNMMGDIATNKKTQNLWSEKNAYIIDCSEFSLNANNHMLTNDMFAGILSSFINIFQHSATNYLNSSKKIILLSRHEGQINHLLTQNIEFLSTTILKPDFNERYEFIKNHSTFFNLENIFDSTSRRELSEAASLTSRLSFREILQMAKISQEIDVKNFRALYNLAMFDKQASEWEKIDKNKMQEIDNVLSKRVKGQEYAIGKIKDTIIRSYVGLSGVSQSKNNKKPKGILFFCGPTGVGKTELAKALSEFIFGDENKFIRFDMSEYNHENSDQKLIGAPPGYVGYESGGQLTNAVKENPFSVLLFDEIEKAHSKILDKFLQILEDGRLTSSKGELVDFSETFIIFTSNIGANKIKNKNYSEEQCRELYINEVSDHFINKIGRPEILNRIGVKNIVPFNYIKDIKFIQEIVKHKYHNLCDKLYEDKNIILKTDNDEYLTNLSKTIKMKYDEEMGGRAIVTEFETLFVDELGKYIFENINSYNSKTDIIINWIYKDNKVEFKDN